MLVLHGGGMAFGCALDIVFRHIAQDVGDMCTLLAPEYGLSANGHVFPEGIDDCLAALRHAAHIAESTCTPLVLVGYSAGAYLSLAVSIRARDVVVDRTILISPSTHIDADDSRPAEQGKLFGPANSLTKRNMRLLWHDMWVRPEDRVRHFESGYSHDLRIAQYGGLGACTILAATYDCTRSECEALYHGMHEAGCNVNIRFFECSHAFMVFAARKAVAEELQLVLADVTRCI